MFCFFLFCLALTLIRTTNGDIVSNARYQRYHHSAILLNAPRVWDRSWCLCKAILVLTEINLSMINKLKINKNINKSLDHNVSILFVNNIYWEYYDRLTVKIIPDISKISDITLPLSLISLFLRYAVWFVENRKGNTLLFLFKGLYL